MSVAAFVISLFGVGIAAIPLGIWGIVRTSRGARRGRGFAIAALAVSAVWAVVATVAVAALIGGGVVEQLDALTSPTVTTGTEPSATGANPEMPEESAGPAEPVESESVYWQDVEPGMCILAPEETETLDLEVVDCGAAHHAEVVARTTLPGTRTYPGDEAVEKAAVATCVPAFDRFVGVPFDTSRLDLDFFATDPEGWESGDRTVVCLLFDPDQETSTKSFKGSKE